MFNFSISWLIFWMKGRVEVDNQSVRSRIPRLLIWIFPYGMVAKDVNLADIKATEVKSKNQIFPLLLGIVLIVLGILSTMNDGVALGILAIIIGIILGGAGFKARFSAYHHPGNRQSGCSRFSKGRSFTDCPRNKKSAN